MVELTSRVAKMLRFYFSRMTSIHRCLVVFCIGFAIYCVVILTLQHGSIRESIHLMDNKNDGNGNESIVNETWVKLRKALLKESNVTKVFLFTYMRGGSTLFGDIFNIDPPTNLMFYEPLDAFYQSYAGFIPNAIPLSYLYDSESTPRRLGKQEINEMTDYLEFLFNCRFEKLPIETFAHNYFGYTAAFKKPYECFDRNFAKKRLTECMEPIRELCGNVDIIRRNMTIANENNCPQIIRALRAIMSNENDRKENMTRTSITQYSFPELKTKVESMVEGFSVKDELHLGKFIHHHVCRAETKFNLKKCMYDIDTICREAKLVALKVIRSRMIDLETLIQRIPDIHVLYYIRDPRAIINSRLHVGVPILFYKPRTKDVVSEAKVLCHRMSEDVAAKNLFERKYPGAITTIRYEDFVQDLNGTTFEVFEKLGYRPSKQFSIWLNTTLTGSSHDGPFGIRRPNTTASINRWKMGVSYQEGLELNRLCQSLLQELGYAI